MNKNLKVILIYIAFFAVILLLFKSATGSLFDKDTKKTEYSDILSYFEKEEVKSFSVDASNKLTLTLHETETVAGKERNKTVTYMLRSLDLFYTDTHELVQEQAQAGVLETYDYEAPAAIPWWVNLLPYVIMIILFAAFWFYMSRQMNGGGKIGNFGRARVKMASDERRRVTFADVAGADEEKEELEEIVEFLKNPKEFERLGAKIPHGVLLMGPPGTGKTLLAKAVAGEANVPFYSISGSDFVEMYVGVGASRVRDLFETARRHPASIVFIDEIDAVGRQRGTGLGGGHDEREQTLNQLLVEMDGFGLGSSAIIVIAATNRSDILDPALLRPGRFDRQITVSYPDVHGREEILKVHAKGKPFESDVDFPTIAKATVGFTGADLANLLNEAALLAARRKKSLIGMNDIEDALLKVEVGPQKKSRKTSDKEKKLTSYHEAGHAIATHVIRPDENVHQISIIPAGMAGGYTLSLPKEDRSYASKGEMEAEIVTLLGGRCAEALILGDISTGASNDIERATNIARSMVMRYGMSSKLGPIVYGTDHGSVFLGRDFSAQQNYSDKTAADIDEEIQRIIKTAYEKVEQILKDNMDKLHFVAEFLFKNEVMEEDQFAAAMAAEAPVMEEIEALRSERAKRSERENAEAKKRRAEEEAARRKKAEEGAHRTDELDPEEPGTSDDGFPPRPKD